MLYEEGWLRSGDLGRIERDGSVVLTGRSKELYKCGGELPTIATGKVQKFRLLERARERL